ncbi:MAG: hypothetical protein AAGG81_02300 [Chlamydiota bacterium]
MSNKMLIVLIGLAIVLMMVLFFLNYVQIIETKTTEKRVEANNINGMEVYHKNIPYTLNLNQQAKVATYLNEAVSFQPSGVLESRTPSAIEKIVIYRFEDLPPIEITPVYYHQNNLIFSAPDWQESGLLMDNSNGKLKDLLSQTFDR